MFHVCLPSNRESFLSKTTDRSADHTSQSAKSFMAAVSRDWDGGKQVNPVKGCPQRQLGALSTTNIPQHTIKSCTRTTPKKSCVYIHTRLTRSVTHTLTEIGRYTPTDRYRLPKYINKTHASYTLGQSRRRELETWVR